MKCKEFTLTGEQVMALFNLLYHLNLRELSDGKIVVHGDQINASEGELLRDMFYSNDFAEEDKS